MSDVAIRIENLGKRYRYGGAAPLSYNLRQDIADWAKGLLRRNDKRHATLHEVHEKHIADSPEYFWAIKNIDLEINRGDVVGIIGRNGAGKSTLLKILSRITPPTTGKITLNGRVASLLEVGTGFHRELTGRENIFLNGSILGMRRAEISSKLDEIVAFAEIDKFIDTPVKFYSSGMYVRLAFAVAAHLDPEILIVDEVLAVGDASFQKKCLGKMGEVAKQGRTILFVSHNMNAILRLCPTTILIQKGAVAAFGQSSTVVSQHLATNHLESQPGCWIAIAPETCRGGTGEAKFVAVSYGSPSEEANFHPYPDCCFIFNFDIWSNCERSIPSLAVAIYDLQMNKLLNVDTISTGLSLNLQSGTSRVSLKIQQLHLKPGRYVVGLWMADAYGEVLDTIESAFEISVMDNVSSMIGRAVKDDGVITCDFECARVHESH